MSDPRQLVVNGDQLTFQQFVVVAGRRAELNQVDRMLDQGSKFSDILLGPAIITWPKEDDPGDQTLWAEIVE